LTKISVQPDREWFITEWRLRFAVDAEVPRALVPIVIFKDLQRAIDIMENVRHWKFIDTMPTHKKIIKPCCTQIATAKAGQPIKMVFEPSVMQGDTDDAHNSGLATTGEHRLHVDNKIDWVAVCHFWVPGLSINLNQQAEETPRENEGFVSPELLPKEFLAVNKRYKNV
jgi:hypothetical protein